MKGSLPKGHVPSGVDTSCLLYIYMLWSNHQSREQSFILSLFLQHVITHSLSTVRKATRETRQVFFQQQEEGTGRRTRRIEFLNRKKNATETNESRLFGMDSTDLRFLALGEGFLVFPIASIGGRRFRGGRSRRSSRRSP